MTITTVEALERLNVIKKSAMGALDARTRRRLADHCLDVARALTEVFDNDLETVAGRALGSEHRCVLAPHEASAAGRAAAEAFRVAHPGEEPLKRAQYVDGAVRYVHAYGPEDLALVDAAIRSVRGRAS